MQNTTLHYIYDPLCGWCYAVAPLMDAAAQVPGLKIQMHGGGLFADGNVRTVGAQMRDFILSNDARIAALSGQEFGDAYKNELLASGNLLLDSAPPTRAILAAEQLAEKGLAMQRAIQRAHYVSGKRVVEADTLEALATEIGLDPDAFRFAYRTIDAATVKEHMRAGRSLMENFGGAGFPTFVLERGGKRAPLAHQNFLGKPEEWKRHLQRQIEGTP